MIRKDNAYISKQGLGCVTNLFFIIEEQLAKWCYCSCQSCYYSHSVNKNLIVHPQYFVSWLSWVTVWSKIINHILRLLRDILLSFWIVLWFTLTTISSRYVRHSGQWQYLAEERVDMSGTYGTLLVSRISLRCRGRFFFLLSSQISFAGQCRCSCGDEYPKIIRLPFMNCTLRT